MVRSFFRRRGAPGPIVTRSRRPSRPTLSLQQLEDRAVPALGTFEIDGNATTQVTHDWDQVYNDAVVNPSQNTSGSIPGAVVFIHDKVNSAQDNIFAGGGSKDLNDLNQWQIGQGAPQSKADIADVYAAAYSVLVGGQTHTVVAFGADRISNSASTSLGFWFFQNPVSVNANGTFSGLHTVGDILVVADFSNSVATINAYKWVGPGGSAAALQPLTSDPSNLTATVNTANTPSGGWPFTSASPPTPANTFAPGEFFEGAIDLTALGLPNDLSTFVAETRASTSLNATLSDFVIGGFTTFTADLALTKTVSNPTPNVGDTVTFTVNLTNNGPNNATGVSVNDLLPPGLALVSATPSQGSYDSTTGLWTVGDVARGQTPTLQLVARVVTPDPQTNTATVAGQNERDPDSTNNQASATETPQRADLALTKTVNNARPNVGDTITFTLTLTDKGPNTATDVTVQDLLPAGVAFVSATPSQGSYNSSTGAWNVGTVTTTKPQTLLIQGRVVSPNAQTNTAAVSHADQFDPDTGNNSPSVTETPQQADLAVIKTVSNPTPNVGDTITYTITLTDNGPDPATNVTVQDPLPAGVSFISATPAGSYNPSTGTWTVGTIAVGTPKVLTITARVTSPSPGANTATISHADQFDPNTANNSDTASTNPQEADLALTKSVSNPRPNVGDTITFTVTLTDTGPANATGVQVTDVLPAGLTLVSATPSQGTFAGGVWTAGSVANGAQATLTLQARVVSPVAQTNTAAISAADQVDPNAGNNSASATETPQQADLTLTKTVNDPTPNVGDTVTFTVALDNNGPDAATNVTVADVLPAGLTLVSSTPSQGTYAGGIWTVGTVNPSTAPTLTITARVASAQPATNTATISHEDQFDPDTTNNTTSATETPQQADLAVTKSISDPTPNVGDTITFTITLTNNGPDAATNVTVADALPAGLTLVNATPSQGTYTGGVWTVGTVSVSAIPTLTVVALVASPNAVTNTATISHEDQFDPNTTNNSASVGETPREADLRVTKTVSDPTPNVGDTIFFTVTVTNLGPDDTDSVSVQDLMPAGLAFVSATPSQGTYQSNTGKWNVGGINVAASATLILTATVVSSLPQTNTATISHSNEFDPNPDNDTDSATETPQNADLALAKSVSNPTPNVGDTVTFTVTLTDKGADTATNVTVQDLLPAGLAFVSATPSQGTYSSTTGVWTVGTVTTTTPQTLLIQGRVVSPNAQTNTAAISNADQFDPDSSNNQASATETPRQADLVLTKTVNDPTPNVGDTITFTLNLTNQGPNAAHNVTVQDLLPAGLTFVSATPTHGTYSPATGTWSVGTLANLGTARLTITATVDSAAPVTNSGAAGAAEFDPDKANNQDSVLVSPQSADLAVTKTVDNPTPTVGDTVTYTITVTNLGPDTATNITLHDTLPPGVTLVSAHPSRGTFSRPRGDWTIASLAAGASAMITIQVKVTGPAPTTNTVTITGADQFDPVSTNNTSSSTITPQVADLVLSKAVSDSTPNVGDTITFTVTVTNQGPTPAAGVVVNDALPPGLAFVSATPSQGAYSPTTDRWTVGTLANGDTATLQITAQVSGPAGGTNVAVATSTTFDPNTANNTDSASYTPQQADLAVTKAVDNPTPTVGDKVNFTVTLKNNGPSDATGVTVHDLLPAGLALVSATPSQGTYDSATGTWTVGTVANGTSATLILQATVTGTTAATNVAAVSTSDVFDPKLSNNTGQAVVAPQLADLHLVKTVNNPHPNVGDTVTFTLNLTNQGPNPATSVTVTDPLPAGLTFVSATPTQGAYDSTTGVWAVGALANQATSKLTITARVDSPVAMTNTGTAAADQFDPDQTDNSASAIVTPQQADLEVQKTVDNANPNVGDTVTYTITVINLGPDTATNITLHDTLPPGVAFLAAHPSRGTFLRPRNDWTIASLAAGASATITIQVKVTSPAPAANTVTITGADQFDPNNGNNTASSGVTPLTADLSLTKTVDNPTPNVGDTVTFSLTLMNTGPDPASGVMVSDPLPAGLAFLSASPNQGTYDHSTGVWTIGTLAGGGTATMTITARVDSPEGGTNVAVASSGTFDPNPGNNTGTSVVTPQQADLAVTKTVSNPTPNVGDTVSFTITLENNGPSAATGVTLHDLLPAGLTFVSANPAQGAYDPTSGTWTVGTVANGASTTLVLQATVASPAAETNVAAVSASDVFDPNPANNTAQAVVTPQQADLHLIKTVNNPTPNVGDTVTFTLTLTNQGPNAATNVTVNDLLPAGLTFVSASPAQGTYDSGTGVWAVGALASKGIARLTITARLISPQPSTNTAAISHSDQFDPDPADNSGNATVTPQQADLAVTKTVDNPTPNVGDTVTYTITVTNLGPDTATNITLHDTLPPGVTLLSVHPSRGTFSRPRGDWTIASLAAGASAMITIQVKVTGPAPTTNTVTITGADQFDPNTGNNSASSGIDPLVADLALTKTVSNSTPNVGDTINYTLTLTNQGPDAASGVVVSDPLPAGLTFIGSTSSQGTYDPATGVWSFGTLAGSATATLVIAVRVDSAAPATNVAVAHSNTFDPDTTNNTGKVDITPQQADLAVTKTVDNPTPNVGDTVTFTVTLTDHGPTAATGVAIQDLLPADVVFVGASPGQGTFDSSTGIWTVGTLANGATTQLTIQAKVTGPAAGTNVASVSAADQPDPNPNNNAGTATITPQQADLHLVKTVNNSKPNVGDTVTFTLTLNNQGPNSATNVTVNDLLPAGLTFVSATPSQGTYNPGTGVWAVGTLANQATVHLTITAHVVTSVPVVNAGTAAADQFDPDPGDNQASVDVTPQRADLAVIKTVDNPAPNVGDVLTYTITLTNFGPDTATGITVHDPLPSGVTFDSATPSSGTYNSTTGVWAINSLANGASATLVIKATVTSPVPGTNTAAITGADQFDPNPANNTASASATPLVADLSLTKTVNNPTPNVGDTITFTLTLSNAGQDPASGVVVSDPLPAGLTFQGANPSQGTYDHSTGVWTFGTLAANATATMTITARVDSPAGGTNVAVASSNTFDPDTSNNTATADTTPQQADLAVTKTVSNPTPNVSDTVTFTVTLTDHGPDDATNVTANDLLPAGLAFVSANPSQGTYDQTTGAWTVGNIANGASVTLVIQARVTAVAPQANVVTITHSDQFDPEPKNDQSTAIVSASQSDLAVTKVADVSQAPVGSLVTFTVAVHNLGPSVATGVLVTDKLPPGLAFVSAQPSQGTYQAGTGQWDVGTLAPGGSAKLRITVRVTAAVTYRNTARVTFQGADPDLSNNTAFALVIGLPSALSKRNLLGTSF